MSKVTFGHCQNISNQCFIAPGGDGLFVQPGNLFPDCIKSVRCNKSFNCLHIEVRLILPFPFSY